MMRFLCPLVAFVSLSSCGWGTDWPQFRGAAGAGAGTGEPPVGFGPQSNVVWRIPLPPGNSSPVIWGDRIFLTDCAGSKLETLCLDRHHGRVLWRQVAPAVALETTHRLSNPATPTPVTDGERVYAYFGSFGLLAYDFSGHELWRRELPAPVVEFGTSASPLLAGENVILLRDQDTGSHLLALNRRTGVVAWRVERPEFRRSFATPYLWRHDGSSELIVPGSIWLKSYNPATGAENWTVAGTSRVATSTPVAGGGLLFNSSWNVGGDEGERLSLEPFADVAKKQDANGDGQFTREELPEGPVRERFSQMDLNKDGFVTAAEWEVMRELFAKAGNAVLAIRPGGGIAWRSTRSLPYVSSPLFDEGRVFTMKNGGLASCYEAATGRPLYQDERVGVGGDYYASAVAAGGRIYLPAQNGTVVVLRGDGKFEVLARNVLGEEVFATPAIVDGHIYLRSATQLWAFGAEAVSRVRPSAPVQ